MLEEQTQKIQGKLKSKTKTNPVQSVYMEKIKENDKIFDEKMSTLKQK